MKQYEKASMEVIDIEKDVMTINIPGLPCDGTHGEEGNGDAGSNPNP